MVERLLIVVPESELKATHDLIAKLAVSGWEQSVQLATGPVRRGSGPRPLTLQGEAERILQLKEVSGADSLIVTREIKCDHRILTRNQNFEVRRPFVGDLRRNIIRGELDVRKLGWHRILEARLAYWGSKKSDAGHWLDQFDRLGARWVGEGLLRQVDVVPPGELWRAFDFPPQAMLGTNLILTFVLDGDHASSSNRIGAMLTQTYGKARDFVDALKSAPAGSRLVACEDALWTGTELRRLLKRIATGGDLQMYAQDKRITFRHCVVCDYGVWVGRHFIEHNKLENNVDLWLGEQQRFIRVLDVNDEALRSHWHLSPEQFDEWLSTRVKPLAFQNTNFWQGRQEEAQSICQQIGAQLIEKYVSLHGKGWSSKVIDGFSIGAGRFGGSLMFAHSVPKVCLPVFWLGAPVSVGNQSVEWKPLLYDARLYDSSRK